MSKRLLYSFLFLLFSSLAIAQPKPCGPTATMTPTCLESCIICDIDGFKGINSSTVQGTAPPGFCTSQLHNAQWIAFIAGSTNLTLEFSVTNCKEGQGLEVGLYQGIDCKNYKLVSNCDTDIPNNTKQLFKNTTPLIIGQYYFFVMDGSNGDICSYEIKVTEGSTKVSPLFNSGKIKGDFFPCEGAKYVYENEGVAGAIDYNWTIDGAILPKGKTVTLDLKKAGTANLCCTASNACDKAPPVCQQINIKAQKFDTLYSEICEGNCLKIVDSLLCKAGKYVIKTKAKNACDSTVTVFLKENKVSKANLTVNFCEGDTVKIAKKTYLKGGVFTDLLQTTLGCDSLLTLTLNEILCNIKGTIAEKNANCKGEKTGELTFIINNGTPPFTYIWQKINEAAIAGNGNVPSLNENTTIPNLSAGTYFVTINDNFSNIKILQGIVNEPDSLQINFRASDFLGYNLACAGDKNATLEAIATGGSMPYQYLWSNYETTNSISQLAASPYKVTVTDTNKCQIAALYVINEPQGILFKATFFNPDCSGGNSGKIQIDSLQGGVLPYTFLLNNKDFGDKNALKNLSAGFYSLKIKDANDCYSAINATKNMVAAEIPVIDLGVSQFIKLGENILLPIAANINLDSIIWGKKLGLSCYNCNPPDATPYKSTLYKVQVFSKDGCATSDSVWVIVDKNHVVFIPNVFSPNDDGYNDRLQIFGGRAATKVKLLRVFDRWGDLVFEQRDFLPNDPAAGWDGSYKGKPQDSNVFTWYADIEFLDGEIETFKGNTTLIK